MIDLNTMGSLAKSAARQLRTSNEITKRNALEAIASGILDDCENIINANTKDVTTALKSGMSPSMIDRLSLSEERVAEMSAGILAVSKWEDPVGKVIEEKELENGLLVQRINVPLGVVGIIFESRPNVTSDCAALCIKAGNSVILRGGKEAFNSNSAIVASMRKALSKTSLPSDCVQLVTDTSRDSAIGMMNLTKYLDVLIPRGGAGLIASVVENSKVPVIETGSGNCHIYVDKDADISMAASIVLNSKASRPSVCNAAENLLIHEAIAETALPVIARALKSAGVTLHGDSKANEILSTMPEEYKPLIFPASESDWAKEYLSLDIAVKIVASADEAIEHIEKYSTSHSECIVTENPNTAHVFLNTVDSAAVYHNASTRFTDGGQLGLGAEIGISTQKLHARGPMGVNQLVSYKYVIEGNGQIR